MGAARLVFCLGGLVFVCGAVLSNRARDPVSGNWGMALVLTGLVMSLASGGVAAFTH